MSWLCSEQEVNRVFRLIDEDKSGAISTDEFIEMMFPVEMDFRKDDVVSDNFTAFISGL